MIKYVLTPEGKERIVEIADKLAPNNTITAWVRIIGCEFYPNSIAHMNAIEHDLMKYFERKEYEHIRTNNQD